MITHKRLYNLGHIGLFFSLKALHPASMTNYESASSASFALPSRCGSVVLQQQQEQSQSCTVWINTTLVL